MSASEKNHVMRSAPISGISENFLKVTGHTLSFALFMALIGVWVVTRPILRLTDQMTLPGKEWGRPEHKAG